MYLGRPTGDPDYMFGVQSRQSRGFWLGHTQGVKVLALVVAAPAVDLTVLSQGQAVGGPCSHINHLLPWGKGGCRDSFMPMTCVAIKIFTLGHSGQKAFNVIALISFTIHLLYVHY